MSRVLRATAAAVFALLLLPGPALAAGMGAASPYLGLHVVVSLVGLSVAMILLVKAFALRNLARGGAVANKIGYVGLAVICLAASAVAEWGTNFAAAGLTLEQTNLASELLVIVAMAFLAAYFASVGAGMRQYRQSMTDRIASGESDAAVTAERDDRA